MRVEQPRASQHDEVDEGVLVEEAVHGRVVDGAVGGGARAAAAVSQNRYVRPGNTLNGLCKNDDLLPFPVC